LFASLRTVLAGAGAVVASALLFGIFHEVIFPGRLLASTFLGLVLGWVRLRSGSIVPCIVLHAIHNGLLLAMSYWGEEISARWDVHQTLHLPPTLLALSALGIVIAAAMLIAGTRPRGALQNIA
jgi:hypothetical protein